jgi:hypothetical protein
VLAGGVSRVVYYEKLLTPDIVPVLVFLEIVEWFVVLPAIVVHRGWARPATSLVLAWARSSVHEQFKDHC